MKTITMQTLFTYKSAGRFSARARALLLAMIVSWGAVGGAQTKLLHLNEPTFKTSNSFDREWSAFEKAMKEKQDKDRIDGISYLISGSLALIGGLFGQAATKDPMEKGVYTLFQSIGVASIGYGIFTWKLGDEDRWFYDIMGASSSLSERDRVTMINAYYKSKAAREKRQKFVRALTHGLIAALNFYGATQQTNESVKNALMFLGGVNTLAAVSFTF
jgi:hypothetical protein